MTINVINYSDHLIRVHLISGGCRKPLPLELDPGPEIMQALSRHHTKQEAALASSLMTCPSAVQSPLRKSPSCFVCRLTSIFTPTGWLWECSAATKIVIMIFTMRCITRTTVILWEGKPLMALLNINTEMLLSGPQCQTATPRTWGWQSSRKRIHESSWWTA